MLLHTNSTRGKTSSGKGIICRSSTINQASTVSCFIWKLTWTTKDYNPIPQTIRPKLLVPSVLWSLMIVSERNIHTSDTLQQCSWNETLVNDHIKNPCCNLENFVSTPKQWWQQCSWSVIEMKILWSHTHIYTVQVPKTSSKSTNNYFVLWSTGINARNLIE